MKNKSVRALCICLTSALLLTGCSSFPEMTEEQYDQTVQYAVSLLMKYSNNGVERLSSISALELQKQIEKEEREKRKAERDALNQEAVENAELNPDVDEELEETEDVAGLDETDTEKPQTGDESGEDSSSEEKSDDQVKVDVSSDGEDEDDVSKLLDEYEDELKKGEEAAADSENTDDEENAEDSENPKEETKTKESENSDSPSEDKEEPLQEDSSQEELAQSTDKTVDGMRQELSKGIFLTYSGYSVAGSYPDDDDVFVINAEAGRKLLILNFRISNTSGSDMTVDMEKGNPHFQVVLNGKNVGYTNVTWLDNDLSTFKGTIKAGDKLSMVLVKQMDAAKVKSIDSLSLIGDLGGETIQFNLE